MNVTLILLVCAVGLISLVRCQSNDNSDILIRISIDDAGKSCVCKNNTSGSADDDFIGFSVASSMRFAPSTESRIPMEKVIYNDGGHFQSDNAFHAPNNGIYSFSFTAISGHGETLLVYLCTEKPGMAKVKVALLYHGTSSGSTYNGSGGSVIVKLIKGETASLWTPYKIDGNTTPSTLFSGKLEKKLK